MSANDINITRSGDFAYQFTNVADQWLKAVESMGGNVTPWQTLPDFFIL